MYTRGHHVPPKRFYIRVVARCASESYHAHLHTLGRWPAADWSLESNRVGENLSVVYIFSEDAFLDLTNKQATVVF